MQIGGIDLHVLHRAFGHAGGDMAGDGADLAIDADAGFARVVLNDGADGVVGDLASAGRQAGGLELESALGWYDLSPFLGVAGESMISMRSRSGQDWRRSVGRADEHHPDRSRGIREYSCRGRSSSARVVASRAGAADDRRGSPGRACPSRRAESPDCASRLRIAWITLPAARRYRCGGGRGSPPRRAGRQGSAARIVCMARASIDRARSCPRREGPTKHRMGLLRFGAQSLRTARNSRMRCLIWAGRSGPC